MKSSKLFALLFCALVCGDEALKCVFDENCKLIKWEVIAIDPLDTELNALQRGLVRLYGDGNPAIKNVFVYFETENVEFCLRTDHKDEVEVTVVSVPTNPPTKCNRYSPKEQVTSDLTDDEVRKILKSMCNALQIPQDDLWLSACDHFLPKKAVITRYAEEIINFDGVKEKGLLFIGSSSRKNYLAEYLELDHPKKKPDHLRLELLYQQIVAKQMPIYPIKSVIELDIQTLLKFMELLQDCIERTPGLETDCIQKALDGYRDRIKLLFPGFSDKLIAEQRNNIELLECLPSYDSLKALFTRLSTDLPDAPQDDINEIKPNQVRDCLKQAVGYKTQNNIHLFACATAIIAQISEVVKLKLKQD